MNILLLIFLIKADLSYNITIIIINYSVKNNLIFVLHLELFTLILREFKYLRYF